MHCVDACEQDYYVSIACTFILPIYESTTTHAVYDVTLPHSIVLYLYYAISNHTINLCYHFVLLSIG
jgi:hypothetical protein